MEKENESIGFLPYFINILSSQTEKDFIVTAIGFNLAPKESLSDR
jgi:hypothetical protein